MFVCVCVCVCASPCMIGCERVAVCVIVCVLAFGDVCIANERLLLAWTEHAHSVLHLPLTGRGKL